MQYSTATKPYLGCSDDDTVLIRWQTMGTVGDVFQLFFADADGNWAQGIVHSKPVLMF